MAEVGGHVIRLLGVAVPLYLSMAAASASAMVSSAALGRYQTLGMSGVWAAIAAANALAAAGQYLTFSRAVVQVKKYRTR